MKPAPPLCLIRNRLFSTAGLVIIILINAQTARAETTLSTSSLDSGGQRTTVGAITIDGSVGGIGAYATNATQSYETKTGFAGQLYDLAAIQLTASPSSVNETATRQLNEVGVFDDDTKGALATNATWGVVSGPLASVDGSGLATAGTVYQDTVASAYATFNAVTGTIALLIVNVNDDNYGLYAGDNIADTWQIQYFGIGNTNGQAAANPDNDPMNNLAEYRADTNPTNILSYLHITAISNDGANVTISWIGGVQATQYLERCTNLSTNAPAWLAIHTNMPSTPTSDTHQDNPSDVTCFYRIRAAR